MELNKQLKQLETPAFNRAISALSAKRPTNLCTVGQYDCWLKLNTDTEAALAWRAYKDIENLIP